MSEVKDAFEARVSRLGNYLIRAYKYNKPSILFAMYMSEFLRTDVEKSLEKSLKEQGLNVVNVDAAKNKDIPSFISSTNSNNSVFLVYNMEKGFPEVLQFLNFKREELVERHIKVIFWVKEEELARISLEAPDFFAFRNRVVEFMELPAMGERRPALVEFALEIEYKSVDEIKRNIELKEKLLSELSDETEISGYLFGTLGILYHDIGSFKKSIEYCKKALEVAQKNGDKELEGVQLGNLGNAYSSLGDIEKASEFYKKALEIAREIDDRRNEGAWLGNLGVIFLDTGKVEKSIEYFEKALRIAKETKIRDDEVNSIVHLGFAYYALGDMRKAIDHIEKSLKISREIGYKRGECASLGSLGLLYYSMGNMRKALEYYEKALMIINEIGDISNESIYLGNIGLVFQNEGDIKKAMEYYKKAIKIAQKIGFKYSEGASLNSLGTAFIHENKYEEALACFLLAKDKYINIKNRYSEKVISNLKNFKKELGKKEFEKLESEVSPRTTEIVKKILEGTSN